ncbi:LmeA family phospholipid-binding protein [Leptothoe spongobia]|uniref:DUF2993 domain-containing protein n=1 Tax=Leptothoe spongobia TAU-MAC 1115 TaxID=1967444 RepID=A0A947DDK4_9CYAN|nr:DUF2993 domain-containing protein [Leptothoe spongobia]MBT9315068.1 DUF2993 domain-containing protein [Leptothoe spongobia TAU-MAC 1115]
MATSSSSSKGSRLISRMLPVAVKFWLQTQLDEIGDLTFEIQATDRQVLSGNIPGVSLSAQQAVYQGVCITDVTVQASDIQINIGQVLRGKPLRLKQAFPIEGQVAFDGNSLGTSSTESVLADGLLDFWQTLLAKEDVATEVAHHYGPDIAVFQDPQLAQYQSRMEILGTDLVLHLVRQGQSDLELRGWVDVEQGHMLRLTTARWCLPSGDQVQSEALSDFSWNLGKQTDLRSLTIQNDQLTCQCKIMVQP